MELKLKSKSSTNGLVNWLKGFKEINSSLLIEVDVQTQEFIAKGFAPERCVVKYSKISFEDAGVELVGVYDNQGVEVEFKPETENGRIHLGLHEILGKTTDVIDMFSGADHEITIQYHLKDNVTYIRAKAPVSEYEGEAIIIKSKTLKMVIKCFDLSTFFEKCTDDLFFNKACYICSPSVYEIPASSIQNLLKISGVFADAKDRAAIKFYSKEEDGKRALYAYDETNGSYDYLLGYYTEGENDNTAVNIFRAYVSIATKSTSSETIKITLDTAGASRILIDTGDSIVVISAITQN